MVDDAKLLNSYASLGIEDVKTPISCIWLCFIVLQVIVFNIVLQLSGLGELVSMMEWNPCCLVDNLYGECESRFLEMIGTVVSRKQEDEVKDGLYEVG